MLSSLGPSSKLLNLMVVLGKLKVGASGGLEDPQPCTRCQKGGWFWVLPIFELGHWPLLSVSEPGPILITVTPPHPPLGWSSWWWVVGQATPAFRLRLPSETSASCKGRELCLLFSFSGPGTWGNRHSDPRVSTTFCLPQLVAERGEQLSGGATGQRAWHLNQ